MDGDNTSVSRRRDGFSTENWFWLLYVYMRIRTVSWQLKSNVLSHQDLQEKDGLEVRVLQGDLEYRAPLDVQARPATLAPPDRPGTATRTPASGTTLEVILCRSQSSITFELWGHCGRDFCTIFHSYWVVLKYLTRACIFITTMKGQCYKHTCGLPLRISYKRPTPVILLINFTWSLNAITDLHVYSQQGILIRESLFVRLDRNWQHCK